MSISPEQSPTLRTWKLRLSYDGTEFFGWQIQPSARTVQGELTKRLRLLFRDEDLKIAGCSRTDAGVHALDQFASFTAETPADFTPEWLLQKLNKWLPDDILLHSIEPVEDEFHARYGNFGKAYTYCISPGVKPHPLIARYVWRTPHPLDVEAIRAAAVHFEGEHDFQSFTANSGQPVDSTVRLVHKVQVLEQDGLLFVNVVGESFLYKMVRTIAGFLVHVGTGYATPEDTVRILEARDRTKAADSAPAQGLFLAKVFWRPDEWKNYTPILPPWQLSHK